MSRIKCFTVAAVACFPSAGLAQAFTFEDLLSIPCGASCPFPGIYLSVSQTIAGQTLTVTPVAGGLSNPFIFAGNSGVPLLGAVSLDGLAEPNPRGGPVLLPLRFSFLNPVSAITFAFGVNGGPDIGPARIQAFDTFGKCSAYSTPLTQPTKTTVLRKHSCLAVQAPATSSCRAEPASSRAGTFIGKSPLRPRPPCPNRHRWSSWVAVS